ncbi:unnamed protein product [Rotaria sp. Silwood1]|nr:unnamed protein product [Rotaria sp. Silwood1]
MSTENISPLSLTSKIHHQRNKFKKNSENTSPTNANDWSITFCIIGSACSNKRLLSSLEDRYVYECINDERQVIRTLAETKILLSQRQLRIFIVDSFDDCIFQYLKDNEDIYTISSELVLSCTEKEIDIPVPRRNRPLYCQHLSSAVICFVGIRRDTHTEFSDFVHYLGGSVRKDYSDQVTHVISHANIGEKYLTAFNMERSEILTEEWLLRCWHERNNRQFNPFDSELIRIYRAKPLHNLNLYFFGFNNDDELQHLHTLTNEHGGFITKEMNEATHIVLSDINLFISTYPLYTRKHRQYIVHVQWFWECLCLMGKADESMYIVNLTSNQTTTPDSSLLLLSPSIHGDSPLHDSSINTTVKRKRRYKHSHINEQIENTQNSKRFNSSTNENENLLDDNIIIEKQQNIKKDNKYLIGMELRETERNYVTMLSNIIRIFKTEMEKDDRRNGPILTKVESTQIFGNIEEIYHLHLSIAEQLDRAINEDECIGSIFLTNSAELLRVYQPYTKFYDKTIEAIHTLEKTNPRFYAYLKICEHKTELADLMIRPIQRLPSVLLLLERLLKYTPTIHNDYQLLTNAIDKLREVAKKLNEERGKTEKHLSMFNIVNSIDNCPPELLAAHRDYIEKFHVIELSQELTTTRTHLTLFLFSDCLEVTKLRGNMWKTPGMKGSKTHKHIALIQLSDIRSLFDIHPSSLTIDETEQFGILCSIDGQTRQFIFRVINGNTNANNNSSKSYFTDSMSSSSSSISTLSNSTHHGNNKTDVLYHLSKVISDDRCLLDKSSLIQTVINSNNNHHIYCSQTSLENSEIDSGLRSTSSLNLLGLALKRGLHKANKRLSRAFSFSPEPNKHLSKKNNSPMHLLQDEWSNTFDSNKRMSTSSRQIMATSDHTEDINLQNLKVEESTTPKPEASGGAAATDKEAKPKKEKSKQEKPKQEKPKQEKPKHEKPKQEKPQATAEAPVEELDFNRSQEEVVQALDQWSKKPATLNKPKPDEKITPKPDVRNIMITSALPYVNNVPHLENAFRCYLPSGHTIGQARPLFKRVEKALTDEYRLRFAGHNK